MITSLTIQGKTTQEMIDVGMICCRPQDERFVRLHFWPPLTGIYNKMGYLVVL